MQINNGFSWTFDTEAHKYEKMRPNYVSELYQDIFKLVTINEKSKVLEVGIGTGQATKPILVTGCNFLAVEYGENLAEFSKEKFKDYPNFSVIASKFEDVILSENSYDLIFSATAFHWIDEEIGYKKVFEALKSGGVFARFANRPYKDKGRPQLRDAIDRIYGVYMPRAVDSGEFTGEKANKIAQIPGKYGFKNMSYRLYKRERSFSAEEYIKLLGTYSDHIAIEEQTRAKFYGEIEAAINSFGGEITIYDTIDLELATKP